MSLANKLTLKGALRAAQGVNMGVGSLHAKATGYQSAGVIDLENLRKDMNKIQRGAGEQVVAQAITTIAPRIQHLARIHAPKKTGNLAKSIHLDYGRKFQSATIDARAPYAAYQEFGTGTRGEYPGTAYEIRPKAAKALRFYAGGSKPIFAKVVRHPGVPPRPFMRRALLEVMSDFEDMILAGTINLMVNTPAAKRPHNAS